VKSQSRICKSALARIVAVLLLIAILVAAIVGVYFLAIRNESSGNSTNPLSQSLDLTSPGVSGHLRITLDFPKELVVSPDLIWMNYSVTIQAIGNLPESFSLSVNAPSGLTGLFSQSTLTVGSGLSNDTLELAAAQSIPPGNYQFAIIASSDGSNFSAPLMVQAVKYLVVTIGTSFIPQNLTVFQGNSVTWLRLNGALSPSDDGSHDVDFSSGIATVSPTLAQFESWNYNFNETGNYSYYCKYHPFMTGEITVVSSS